MSTVLRTGTKLGYDDTEHTTIDEINFLRGIGSYCTEEWYKANGKPTRAEYLRKYRTAMYERVKWGLIDKNEVANYIVKSLGELQ